MDPHDAAALTDRQFQRLTITQRLLTSLEDVVWRYQEFATRAELSELCAEAVTAEIAHHLAVARAGLSRHPALHAGTAQTGTAQTGTGCLDSSDTDVPCVDASTAGGPRTGRRRVHSGRPASPRVAATVGRPD